MQAVQLQDPCASFALPSTASFSPRPSAALAPSMPSRHPKDKAHIPVGGIHGLHDLALAVPIFCSCDAAPQAPAYNRPDCTPPALACTPPALAYSFALQDPVWVLDPPGSFPGPHPCSQTWLKPFVLSQQLLLTPFKTFSIPYYAIFTPLALPLNCKGLEGQNLVPESPGPAQWWQVLRKHCMNRRKLQRV